MSRSLSRAMASRKDFSMHLYAKIKPFQELALSLRKSSKDFFGLLPAVSSPINLFGLRFLWAGSQSQYNAASKAKDSL